MIKKPLLYACELIETALKPGGVAVDATCGNGHDTLFLAERVGPGGKVLAFDIQQQAIEATYKKLQCAGQLAQAQLIQDSHASMGKYLRSGLDAAMFNLGYLPGGNHELVTRPASTVAALRFAAEHLNRHGIITLVIYTGHPGGVEEYEAVRHAAASLPQQEYSVLEYRLLNQVNNPPLLLAVSRL